MLKGREILAAAVFILCCGNTLPAKPADSIQAHKAVKGWLKLNADPLNTPLGRQIDKVNTYTDSNQEPVYYIVYLRPSGFVIVPADDEVEPIVGFVGKGSFDPSPENPLGALVGRDIAARIAIARNAELPHSSSNKKGKAKSKWAQLQLYADSAASTSSSSLSSSVSDIRVSPLIQSQWNQGTVCDYNCYNYYTPKNFRCGCVATAMAQLMRFYEYPTGSLTQQSFTIYVNYAPQIALLRGGDGIDGPYVWSQMPLAPDCTITETQSQAIGALCYDAGIAINTNYGQNVSTASVRDAKNALITTFQYTSGVYGSNGGQDIGENLIEMINPNLDAGYPVILSIGGDQHSVVADGYGYNLTTLYHHINMGHGGNDNVWYNLPDFNYPYNDIVDGCIYNLYVTGSGEIISGRVTTSSGMPISGVTITAEAADTPIYTTTTNSNGIYALAKVTKSKTYTVSAFKAGMAFLPRSATTGNSTDEQNISGNVWSVDFIDNQQQQQYPPTALTGIASTAAGSQVMISLSAIDEGLPNPPAKLTYIISSLPRHGRLTDPCGWTITAARLPYALLNYGKKINYLPCASYAGADSFTFKANDGGTAPDGGDSNTAAITVNMSGSSATTVYQTDFTGGLPAGWSVIDGYSDNKTWMSTNPKNRISSFWTGTFMIVDSDWASYADMDEQLLTGNINCTNLEQVNLSFNHEFQLYGNEIGDVDVSTNGVTWQNAARYTEFAYGPVTLNLSAIADHKPNVRIRWHYYNANYDWYWGIDDVRITAGTMAQPIKGDFSQNCIVDFEDFATIASAWMTHPGESNWYQACDISTPADNVINKLDFAVFADNWLQGVPEPIPGDFGLDGKVDFEDFALLAAAWMTHSGEAKWNPACDISTPADNVVNLIDFAVFVDNWLRGI